MFMTSKHHKSNAFQVAIQLLVVTAREIYMITQVVSTKRPNLEKQHIQCFLFQQRLLFAHSSNRR